MMRAVLFALGAHQVSAGSSPTTVVPGPWPEKVIGLYLLIADDDWPYKSETEWVPQLPDYMASANVLFMAFVHPAKMPALPPAMQYIGQHRPVGTQKVIASIGGQAYSDSASWPWLETPEAAEAMAEQIIKWKTDYGIDGVDLDSEAKQSGPNMYAFAKKLKELDPTFIVTQPVFGYPQVKEENYMVNTCWADGATNVVDAIGIMVYQGTGSLQYVDNYVHGTSHYQGFPIHVDVPSKQVMLGAGGQSGAGTITALAKAAKDQDLSGIMVWYSSVIDSATGKVGNQYGGGSSDSSIQSAETKAAWEQACEIMLGGPCNPPVPVPAPTSLQSQADIVGYWALTWQETAAPSNANLGIAFSGWANPSNAKAESEPLHDGLVGGKWIDAGGGNANGRWSTEWLGQWEATIKNGELSTWDGIVFDIEECSSSGLAGNFASAFRAAKKAGLSVLVTVSHSAPYGCGDSDVLMKAFFNNEDVDILSPQLYTSGDEAQPEFDASDQVSWDDWTGSKGRFVPSIGCHAVANGGYASAKDFFSQYNLEPTGYIVWPSDGCSVLSNDLVMV